MQIVVVGGGITGLSAAWELQRKRPDARVILIESTGRLGGKIWTERIDAPEGIYVCEAGAESFITRKPELWRLAEELGITAELERTSDADGMHIWRDGALIKVPRAPLAFLTSPVLSLRGKLRLLREPFVEQKRDDDDETLADFATRRFGAEALANLIGPILGGIYNADPNVQSAQMSVSYLRELERTHGSVVKGILSGPRSTSDPSVPRGTVRFRRGAQSLIDALIAQLRCDIRLNTSILAISKAVTYVVHTDAETIQADGLIFATPAAVTSSLLAPVAPATSVGLSRFAYQPIGTAILAYRRADIPVLGNVKGLIIPRGQQCRIDAILFASHKQPECAPSGHGLMRVFFGGAAPELMGLSDQEVRGMIASELAVTLNLTASPLHTRIHRWKDGFVQAPVGHMQHVAELRQTLPASIEIAGASYDGVGVSDCIRQGRASAKQLVAAI